MEVYYEVEKVPQALGAGVIVMGTFDGVHRGHEALFEIGARRAEAIRGRLWALTFEPHPSTVLGPELSPPMLCTLERRLSLIEELGVDYTLVVRFDAALAQTSCEDFVTRYLVPCGAKEVVIGYDFTFGSGRKGDARTLTELGELYGFEVTVVPPVSIDGGLVPKSTKVRELLLGGKVEAAAALLGRNHVVEGDVVTGEGRGRTIGFPTANLLVDGGILLPANGVYAGRVFVEGEKEAWPSALNIGTNPTFSSGTNINLEMHLLDYEGPSLVGRRLRVEFAGRIRSEQRFDSVEALVRQIETDVLEARRILERAGEQR